MIKTQINTKSIARIAAIQTIYQLNCEVKKVDIDILLFKVREFYKDKDLNSDYELNKNSKLKLRPSYTHLNELVRFTYKYLAQIDGIIIQYLTHASSNTNLAKLLLATLRVAICEIKYFPNTPSKVIISEYTDIASNMIDLKEIGFVNSLLDKCTTDCRL